MSVRIGNNGIGFILFFFDFIFIFLIFLYFIFGFILYFFILNLDGRCDVTVTQVTKHDECVTIVTYATVTIIQLYNIKKNIEESGIDDVIYIA